MISALRKRFDWRETFAAFTHRDFAILWTAVAISHIGGAARDLSAGWLARQLTPSPLLVSLAPAGNQLGILLFSIPGGAVADRRSRKSVMLFSGTGMAAAIGVLGMITLGGWIQYWHIPLMLFFFGLAAGFWGPTRRAMVPDIVGREHLLNAIVWENMAPHATRVVVPLLVGALLAVGGSAYALLAGMATYVIATALCGLLHEPPMERGSERHERFLSHLGDGLQYVWTEKTVLGLLFLPAIIGLFAHAYIGLLPIFAVDVHQVGAVGLGTMATASGVGTVVGGLLLATVRPRRHRGRLLLVMAAVSAVLLILFALAPAFPVALVALALLTGSNTAVSSLASTLLLEVVPREFRGRVQGVHLPIAMGEAPLGALLVGALAESLGTPIALALGGALTLAVILGVSLAFPALRRLA